MCLIQMYKCFDFIILQEKLRVAVLVSQAALSFIQGKTSNSVCNLKFHLLFSLY